MKVWIDKNHGRHYHKETCPMVNDSRFHYEAIESKMISEGKTVPINYKSKTYYPCSCIYPKKQIR